MEDGSLIVYILFDLMFTIFMITCSINGTLVRLSAGTPKKHAQDSGSIALKHRVQRRLRWLKKD